MVVDRIVYCIMSIFYHPLFPGLVVPLPCRQKYRFSIADTVRRPGWPPFQLQELNDARNPLPPRE